MASIVSHVVYADEYLRIHPKFTKTQEFLLGASFPDIRRICNVTRVQTHNCFDDLDLDFTGMNAFEAGWKFHVWCDLRRNELLLQKGFFEIEGVHDCYYFSSYLVEDKLIWGKYKNWETLQNYFRSADFVDIFEELTGGDWMFWYQSIADFVVSEPDRTSMRKLIRSVPSFVGRTDLILNEVERLMKNKKVTEVLSGIHRELLK